MTDCMKPNHQEAQILIQCSKAVTILPVYWENYCLTPTFSDLTLDSTHE